MDTTCRYKCVSSGVDCGTVEQTFISSLFSGGAKPHFSADCSSRTVRCVTWRSMNTSWSRGKTAKLKNPLLHQNVDSLSRYSRKHDEYSKWDAHVWQH